MRVRYVCEVCGDEIGDLEVPPEYSQRLGFDRLTPDERVELLSPLPGGGWEVLSICERCGPPAVH